jgi:molecular chaperone DnaJ
MKKDYYDILGVPRDADEKAIKAAYRRLARKHHPDVNSGDPSAEERFKEISEAFAVLSDAEKRARYDRGGHAAFGPDFDPFAGFGFDFRGGRATGGAGGFDIPDLSQIFEMFGLGGGPTGARPHVRRGGDLQLEVRIPFEDAIRGSVIDFNVPRHAACGTCSGSGGGGRAASCTTCGGSGLQRVEERLKVRIPTGVKDGDRVRVGGKGDAAPHGGPPGDAYLIIRVAPHPVLRREGRDLLVEVPVGIARASLGGQVEVPTLEGQATIELPPGTRSGQKLRLKGRGVPARGSQPAGDLFAVVQIHPPKDLDARSRELLEELDRLHPTP